MARILSQEGLTFDDVLIVPKRSRVHSRKDVDTSTKLTPKIKLAIPIISANMDTVTEEKMAVAMAQQGGVGVIHRFMPPERQAEQVKAVKRLEAYIIKDPYTINKNATVCQAKEAMEQYNCSLLVVDKSRRLLGIVTHRDLLFEKPSRKVSAVMTKSKNLITAPKKSSIKEAQEILHQHRIEKLPLTDQNNRLAGLVTVKDLLKRAKFPDATKDKLGRLRVGAAIGVRKGYLERAEALIAAEVDFLVVDIAHGHSDLAMSAIKTVKKIFPKTEIVAGNVASPQGVRDLQGAGADVVKLGVGPGSVCSTRIVAGAGYPQLSAIMECVKVAKVPLIADGGIRNPGDITKALAAGAQTVMIGNLLAGTDESPGSVITRDGKRFKLYRGMAGYGAAFSRKDAEGGGEDDQALLDDMTPEGVDALVPYRGSAAEVLIHLLRGLRSGMSYTGAETILELQKGAEFVRITLAGLKESHPHDIERL